MIELIKLNNVRSFVGTHEVPLRKFTLLYGNNGAGKSTIIEAIQLVLTGSSDRPSLDNIGELAQHVRSEGVASGLLIELFSRNETDLPSFSDTGSSLTYSELLGRCYKRNAHHKTAKSLLDTLFSTHNLITQERIIKLLDSDNKSAFYGAIEEMVVGRNLMERWQKVELLKSVLEKMQIDNLKKKLEMDQEHMHLEAHLKEWDSTSAAAGLENYEKIKETATKAGIMLSGKPLEPSVEALLAWVRDTRQIVLTLSNGIGKVTELCLETSDSVNVAELVEKRSVSEQHRNLSTILRQ
jgi:energy-coupling factor transporter ATP-binding protein EcfA2